MPFEDIPRRIQDLCRRAEKTGDVVTSHFLTQAEVAEAKRAINNINNNIFFFGGHEACERELFFATPWYLPRESLDLSQYIRAIGVRSSFGSFGHRDCLGALMGLGIERAWIGDIWVQDATATIFALPSVEQHILLSLDKIGRVGVRVESLPLAQVTPPERQVQVRTFTVQSPRLDAVLAGLFRLSRSESTRLIRLGLAQRNFVICESPDCAIQAGDVLSLRGHGRGSIREIQGVSRKGRLFVTGEICI